MTQGPRSLSLRRGGHVGALVALLSAGSLAALPAESAPTDRLWLGLGLTPYYTDNLLQYSDGQIQQFEAGAAPTHYSIQSIDDGVWRPTVSLTFEQDRGRGHGRELRLRGGGEFHQTNATADFRGVSFTWREYFGGQRRLSAFAYYMPDYYLRQLFDEDVTAPGASQYRRAEFSLFLGSVGWRQRLARRVRGEIAYRYEHRGYNPDFEERTSNTHQGDASVEWYRAGRGGLELHGGYRKTIAHAQDADGVIDNDPDVSYHGILAGLAGRWMLSRRGAVRWGMDASWDYGTRAYESDRPSDAAHYGRDDTRHIVEVGLRVEPGAGFTARGFYHYEQNDADFPPGGGTALDPSSYREGQIGAALDWSKLLWKSGQPAAAGPSEGEQ